MIFSMAILSFFITGCYSSSEQEQAARQFLTTFFTVDSTAVGTYKQAQKALENRVGSTASHGSPTPSIKTGMDAGYEKNIQTLHERFKTLVTADEYQSILYNNDYTDLVGSASGSACTLTVQSVKLSGKQQEDGSVTYNFAAEVQAAWPASNKKMIQVTGMIQLSKDSEWKVSYFKYDQQSKLFQ